MCLGACAARPQSLQTVGGNNHRLHTLKPTDSSPQSIYLTIPIFVFSPPYQAPSGVTDSNSSIHLPGPFILHQHPFIRPSPSFTWPPQYLSSICLCQTLTICTYCSIRTFSNKTQSQPLQFLRFVQLGSIQDSGKNYYPAWYLLPLPPTLLKSRTSNPCLFSLNASPAPSLSSRLQTSDHRALIGGLRGNSYHTAII